MDMYQKREMRKNKKMDENTKSLPSTSINWYPGHMARTKREIKEKINLIDIVLEVIDSRMPISSKIIDIDEYVKNKPKILIMTKYDMCDVTKTNKFIDYYKNKGYDVIPVDLINNNASIIIEKCKEHMNIINTKRKEKGLKPKAVRALVVGVPNAGKSTLINRLVGKKATVVGNRPGVTKNLGWIRINKDIELLDSPGILWPKFDNQEHAYNLAALSSIKEEIIDNEDLALFIINKMVKLYPDYLISRYKLENIDLSDINNILDEIATNRGALSKGGIADYDKVYNIIIRDLKDGNFGRVTFDEIPE